MILNDDNIRTAIVLGAGASSADGAPMNLLEDYLNLPPSNPENLVLEERRPRVRTLLEQLFPGQSYPHFEDLLGIIALAMQRKETFKGYGGGFSRFIQDQNERDLQLVHEDLILSIAEVITRKIAQTRRNDNRNHHDKFVTKIKNTGYLYNIIFLTTNYDILLDNALTRAFSENPDELVIPDYGMNYNMEGEAICIGNSIPLFKLHGSLNWLYCPRCIRLDLKPYHKSGYAASFTQTHCSICGQSRLAVIIPPTPLKDIDNPYLQQIWYRAEQELKRVDRFVFCGYSLPQADLQFKYLLKRAQINRKNDRRPIDVFVINNEPGEDDIDEWMEKQFNQFFGRTNVECLPHSFEDFALRGRDIIPRRR